MNKKMFKRISTPHKLSFILLLISLILVLFNIKATEHLFYIAVAFNLFEFIKFMTYWSREGSTISKKCDSSYDKNLTRGTSDYILFMAGGYGFIICIPFIASIFINNFPYQKDVIIGLFIAIVVWNYILFRVVDKTSKQIVRLEKDRQGGRFHGNKKN